MDAVADAAAAAAVVATVAGMVTAVAGMKEESTAAPPAADVLPGDVDEDMERGVKRPLGSDDGTAGGGRRRKQKKQKMPGAASGPKNAMMLLNELRPGLEFLYVTQTGPVHAPTFTMAVTVDGVTYDGSALTKRRARLVAAEKVIATMVQVGGATTWRAILIMSI